MKRLVLSYIVSMKRTLAANKATNVSLISCSGAMYWSKSYVLLVVPRVNLSSKHPTHISYMQQSYLKLQIDTPALLLPFFFLLALKARPPRCAARISPLPRIAPLAQALVLALLLALKGLQVAKDEV